MSDMAPSGIKAKFCNDHNIDYDEVCWLWQKAETAAFEEAAKLHEQVTLEGRHEDAMAAVIEYRDLIRAAAKRHAPLQYPDDRSALIEKACSAPDGCISAGQGGAG